MDSFTPIELPQSFYNLVKHFVSFLFFGHFTDVVVFEKCDCQALLRVHVVVFSGSSKCLIRKELPAPLLEYDLLAEQEPQ